MQHSFQLKIISYALISAFLIGPSQAHAFIQGLPFAGRDILSFLPMAFIFVVFYILLIRPQQKKNQQHQAMLQSLTRGDKVVLSGGIIGKILKVTQEDKEIELEIAQGVKIKALRAYVAHRLDPSKNDLDISNN